MKRVLYIPLVSHWTLEGNEGFDEFFAFSDQLRRNGEKIFWYVVMPSWITDGLRGHDRMQYVYIDNSRDSFVNDVVGFPAYELARYFSRRGGRFCIDGVVSNCVQFASYASRLLGDQARGGQVPLFLRDMGDGIERILKGKQKGHGDLQLFSSYVSGHTGVASSSERSMVSSVLAGKLSPVWAKKFGDSSFIWPVGYDLRAIDEHVEMTMQGKWDGGGHCGLFCGGDFDNTRAKRFELEVARRLFALTSQKVSIVSQSQAHKLDRVLPSGNDKTFIHGVGMGVKGESYKRSLSRSHMFVSALNNTDASMWEEELGRLLYGQIGVFPHLGWSVARLGEDYPFFYNDGSMDEALLLVQWIAENYEDACKRVEGVVERLRVEHDVTATSDMAWSFMSERMGLEYRITEAREKYIGNKFPLFPTIYKVAKGLGDEFSLDVFLDVMEEHLSWLKPWGRKGSLKELGDVPQALPTLYDIREMLDNLGWIDTCESSDIVVRRSRPPLEDVHVERFAVDEK